MPPSRTPLYVSLLLVTLTVGYGVFQARHLIVGPVITLSHPIAGETLRDPTYEVQGTVKNITRLSIHGAPVIADVQGAFSARYSTPRGLGIIHDTGEDRFGRTTTTRVEIYGAPEG